MDAISAPYKNAVARFKRSDISITQTDDLDSGYWPMQLSYGMKILITFGYWSIATSN